MKTKTLTIYTVCHLLVDLCCIYIILSCSARESLFFFLLYNFCAFALQLPIGMLCDRIGGGAGFAALGCLFVMCGSVFTLTPYLAAVLCGIGNACFHIGGGTDVLHNTNGAGAVGVFVAFGALGLFIGRRALLQGYLWWLPVLLMLSAFALILTDSLKRPPTPRTMFRNAPLLPVLCIFSVTAIRSHAGFAFSPASGIILILCVVLGKAAGGILSDRFGLKPVSIITLVFAAVLYILDMKHAAMLFFNMTMPITLFALSAKLNYGAAFGTLCLALFVGFLPTAFGLALPANFSAMCAVSSALLLIGVKDHA